MPDYPFECEDGHVVLQSHLMSEAPPLGSLSVCPCGKPSRRVVASLSRPIVSREDHRDFDGEDWGVHQEAQEDIEWKTALGLADGEKGKGPKAARARPEEIAKKREHAAKGGKVPDSATLGHILPHERHLYVSPEVAVKQAETALAAI